MDRTERFYKIQTMLQSGRSVRMDRFLTALEVSRATFRRDLEYLRDRFNLPIVWDRDQRGYRLDETEVNKNRHELPGLWLSSSEAHALLTMHHLLEKLEPKFLAPHIAPCLSTPKRTWTTRRAPRGRVD